MNSIRGKVCANLFFNSWRKTTENIINSKTIKSKQIFVFLLQFVETGRIMTLMKEVPVLYLVQKITVFR